MPEPTMSYEEVDKHMQAVEVEALESRTIAVLTDASRTTEVRQVLSEVCELYHTIRPFLEFILPFIPGRWREVLKAFMRVLDTLCPK